MLTPRRTLATRPPVGARPQDLMRWAVPSTGLEGARFSK